MKYAGILIPETNIVVEDEIIKMIAEDVNILNKVSFHFSRIEVKKDYSKNEKAFLQEVYNNVGKAMKLLEFIPLDIVGFFCTSAILSQKFNERHFLKNSNNIPILHPLQAVLFALSKIKPKRILLFSPYNYTTAMAFEKILKNEGISISRNIFLNVNRNIDKYDLDRARKLLIKFINEEVDLILILCTNFRTLKLITFFENKFEIPVISSNQALFWMICKKLGVRYHGLKKYGSLFQL